MNRRGILIIATLGASLARTAWAAPAAYEQPPTFQAARILPAAWLKGPYHKVDPTVRNDGRMNHYTVDSRFGQVTADSTAELRIRIDEMAALAAMQKVDTTQQFTRQLKQGGKDTLTGAKSLVTNPVGTITGAVAGIGKIAERAGDALMGDPPSDAEDSRLENAIGYSSTKRNYAAEFRVDPYSSNPLLQQRLNEIAWWGYSGKIAASAASAAIPGGVGAFVSAAKTSNWLEGIPVQMPPSELRKANRHKLQDMGVSADVSDLFLGNAVYSPVQQTKLVNALMRMNNTADRGQFVKFAVLARDAQVAFFRTRQAEMYANLHTRLKRIERFTPVGTNAAARLEDGTLVFCFPLDYMAWTEANATLAAALDRYVSNQAGPKGKAIYVAGEVSPRAKQGLQDLGWSVRDRQAGPLID